MTTMEQSGNAMGAGSALLSDGRIGTSVAAIADWATSTDHKKIGRLFAGFGLLGLVAVSVVAILRSLEAVADLGAFNGQQLNQLAQLHQFGLVLMVALPLTLGLSIAVTPMQVGAFNCICSLDASRLLHVARRRRPDCGFDPQWRRYRRSRWRHG